VSGGLSLRKTFVISLITFFQFFLYCELASHLKTLQLALRAQEAEGEPTLPSVLPPAEGEQILEKSIDPEEYVVGTGDVLSIDLWGEMNLSHQLKITPEGNLPIPRVGIVEVGGRMLKEAKDIIQRAVMKSYKNVKVTVTLVELRKFKVSVTGAVRAPGIYSVFANTRVSEVLEKSGGFLENSSRRNIAIIHSDGTISKADVFKFQKTGDRISNPYVLGGDLILVPARESNINTCGIYGGVKSPGEFEYASEDSLLDLINLADGLTIDADFLRADLIRFNADHKTTRTISIDLVGLISGKDPQSNIAMMPDDRLFIRTTPDFHKKEQVTVNGEVLYPGEYDIEEDQAKLSEVITKAGGFTADASLAEAEMIRVYNVVDPEFERLRNIPVADMTRSEYDYFKLRARETPGRVAVDFRRLFLEGQKEYDVLLKNGDIVNIPPKSMVVNVSGSVVNPGLVPYKSGEDYKYYIGRAGGVSWKARESKIQIVKGLTGERLRPSKSRKIDPGDTILVPEKPERDYWGFFKDTMIVLGNVATIYLVVQQATE
jgi:protein involved in polysaccharide export with SLBB domain